ncbi:MAG: hypothetical protein WA066_02850 [Candidatus Omnitrophota bacterium]
MNTKLERIQHLRNALEDMVNQFAYSFDNPPRIGTGGLSALEHAFEVLGYPDPKDMPERKCQYKRCNNTATCGTPTKNGYRRVCGKHLNVYKK